LEAPDLGLGDFQERWETYQYMIAEVVGAGSVGGAYVLVRREREKGNWIRPLGEEGAQTGECLSVKKTIGGAVDEILGGSRKGRRKDYVSPRGQMG